MRKRENRQKAHRRKVHRIFASIFALLFVLIVFVFVFKPFDAKKSASPESSASQSKTVKTSVTVSGSSSSTSETGTTANWLTSAGKPNEVPILMFHYVSEPTDKNQPAWSSNYMTPENLATICQWLNDNGYTTLTADEAVQVLTGDKKPSNKMVWLTFDDGHENNYTQAYPVLKKYKIHATFNMVTGTLPTYGGTDTSYITLDQMQEMAHSGLISFESHTVSHPDLSTLNATELASQLKDSKAYLDSALHQNTSVIVYPSGKSTAAVRQAAQAAGYKLGLIEGQALAVGTGDLLNTPRFRMSTTSGVISLSDYVKPAETYNTANTAK